ncbi:molybdenum cofactor synthesis 2A [Leptinotarsa decemlineata]|uniref:molybdenum cofactor synthesis 2A n=1 Tax=Leptinotarsa decemlineata TaxID=7539 RepID=UPI003D30BCFC
MLSIWSVNRVMNVHIKILFFAKAREIVGKSSDFINITPSLTYQELLDKIVSFYSLEDIKDNLILSVNEEFCEDTTIILKAGDEIAVIPPLSGG